MTLEIEVLTDKKGSNPGGKGIMKCNHREVECYFKYCSGSRLPPQSAFTHCRQPIYEAITIELARLLGLNVPRIHIISGKDLIFTGEHSLVRDLNPKMPYYFVSEIVPPPIFAGDQKKLAKKMEEESIYRDILQIADIVGKNQNYFFYDFDKGGSLVYLDVGCNFVHATGGFIFLTNELEKNIFDIDVRKEKKRLRDYHLIPNNPDAQDLIPLESLVDNIPHLKIPCVNSRTCKREYTPVSSLLGVSEIADIQAILIYGMCNNFRAIKNSPFIIKEDYSPPSSSYDHLAEQNRNAVYPRGLPFRR